MALNVKPLWGLHYPSCHPEVTHPTEDAAIVADQEGIHVLKAEWSHLNDVARIKDLASRYLNMKPTEPTQIKSPEDLSKALAAPDGDEQAISADKISVRPSGRGARR